MDSSRRALVFHPKTPAFGPVGCSRYPTGRTPALVGSTEIGEIRVGAAGDFAVVEGDPLGDVRVLERLVLVVKGGRTVS